MQDKSIHQIYLELFVHAKDESRMIKGTIIRIPWFTE